MIGEAWFTCAPPISAVSRGFITRLPPTSDWPIATDFMRAPSLAVEASSSTNHIISLQGSMTWSISLSLSLSLSFSLSLSCRCLLALVCYLVVLLSSEWFLPVILLNIEISIESSLCVSFSVCVCASSPALLSSLPPPSPPFSFLPLCLFRFSSWAVLRTTGIVFPPCLLEAAFPPLISSRSTLRPQWGFTVLWRAWNLVEGREKAVLRVCVVIRKRDIIIEA